MARRFLATSAVAGMILIGVAALADAEPNSGDPSAPATPTTTTTNAPYQRPGY